MTLYYRLCLGLTDIGTLHPIDKSPYDLVKNLDQEVFRSVYLYSQEQFEEASREVEVLDKRTGEIVTRPRGVGILTLADGTKLDTLPGITNQLIFDLDSKDNLDKAKTDAIEIIARLTKWGVPQTAIDIYYSGMKGFALKVYLNQFLTSTELHSICTSLIDGLETADTVVYNDSRIVRLPYSKHGKSGLYCTPISLEELVNLKIDDIKDIAKNKYSPEEFPTRIDIPEELLKLKDLKPSEKKKTETKIIGSSFEDMKDKISKLDFSKKMPLMSAAKWVLQQGFIPAGHGQEARMILAATYKAIGLDENEAYYQLKATSKKRAKLLGKAYEFDKSELYNNVIATVYSESWQGGTYSADHPLLATIEQYIPSFLRSPKESQSNITTKDEAFAQFVDYSKEIDQNTIRFGIELLDRNLRVMTKNVYGILGPPSVGKTSIILQILENTSRDGIKAIYFSFDMSNDDTIEKIMVRHTGLDGEHIMARLKAGDEDFKKRCMDILTKHYQNVEFVFKPGLTVEDMENTIRMSDRMSGKPTKLIVVDYLTLIKSGAGDANGKTIEAIQGMRYLAHALNVASVPLLQPNKLNATPDEPITSYNGIKGSSEIAEACTAVITAYREGFSPTNYDNDKFLGLICVKNRKGKLFNLDFNWEGKTGMIRGLTESEKQDLKKLREMKAQKKAEEKLNRSGGSW